MKLGKISLAATVLLSATIFGGAYAKADQNYLDIWNWSFQVDNGEHIKVKENSGNGEYPWPNVPLRIYGWGMNGINPDPHALGEYGIEPNKAYVLEFRLEAESTMPNDRDNALDLNYDEGVLESGSPLQRNKRNFVMRQHPNSPSSHTDPNVYDLLDLTDDFTVNAQIWLPDITSSTPRTPAIYDKWNMIISNYADIQPSVVDGNSPDGKVNWKDLGHMSLYWLRNDCNESNHWCDYADLDRDGKVDFNDFAGVGQQWRVDANSIR